MPLTSKVSMHLCRTWRGSGFMAGSLELVLSKHGLMSVKQVLGNEEMMSWARPGEIQTVPECIS